MIIRLADLANLGSVLAGAPHGRAVFAKLAIAVAEQEHDRPVLLDFSGVEVATASFLRETVIRFRDLLVTQRPPRPLMVVNLAAQVMEELTFFLEQTRDALWSATLDDNGIVADGHVLGNLEDVERQTVDAVAELRSVTARELKERFTDTPIGITAWNNRLANLSGKGLLREGRLGTTKVYQPVIAR